MKDAVRIAVADDEPIMQMYLEETLSDLGYDVVAAAGDGHELIRQCRDLHPDVIVTDIRMPHMDGVEAVREICRSAPLPVVFITGYDEREKILLAESNCVLVFLTKPVGEAALKAAIETVLQRFDQFKLLLDEEPDTQRALENRRLVERAKASLSRSMNLSDRQAFAEVQKQAQARGIALHDAAGRILDRA